jgi:hypothetical protein
MNYEKMTNWQNPYNERLRCVRVTTVVVEKQ